MTITEKIEMYKEKKAFIENISKAFEAKPRMSTVNSVDYEVYSKKINDDITYFEEYVIVYFFGDGLAAKRVTGNSSTANFRAIGTLIDGGYYDEVRDYETLVDRGFERVILKDTTFDFDPEEEKLEALYHDCSEEELREMGCFDNLNEEV